MSTRITKYIKFAEQQILLFLMLSFISLTAFAQQMSFHGRIVDSATNIGLTGSINFRIQVRTAVSAPDNCIMYEEQVTKVLNNGVYVIALNNGTGVRTDTSGYTVEQIFSNKNAFGAFNFAAGACNMGSAISWSPGSSDTRRINISFNDPGTMAAGTWEPLPTQTVSFVPSSIESLNVGGFPSDSLLRVVNGVAPFSISPLSSVQYTELMDLIGGTSTRYLLATNPAVGFTGALAGDITGGQGTTVVSKIRGTSVSAAVPNNNQVLKYTGGAWTPGDTVQSVTSANAYLSVTADPVAPQITLNVGTTANTVAAGDDPRIVSAIQNGGAAGGDLSGTYPNPTVGTVGGKTAAQVGQSVTDTIAATSSATANTIVKRDLVGNSAFATAQATNFSGRNYYFYDATNTNSVRLMAPNAVPSSYSLKLPAADGTAGWALVTDGAGNLAWANPTSGAVTAVTASAPLSSSGGGTPNITISQANGTTAGYLSAADWTTFNNKMSTSLNTGLVWVGNGANVATARNLNITDIKSTSAGNWFQAAGACAAGQALTYSALTDSVSCQAYTITTAQVTGALGYTPVNQALTSGNIYVGNGSNVAEGVTMSGDASISNTGALTISNNAITTAKINNGAVTNAKINDVAWGKITATPTTIAGYGITDAILVNAGGVTTMQAGTMATRPAFGNAGAIYVSTDTAEIYRDDGTAWVKVGSAVGLGGTVTNVSVGGAPLSVVNGTTTPTISISQANGTTSGYLSAADWNAFNSKQGAGLGSGQIWVGNGSNVATPINLSGDATITNTGALGLTTTGVSSGTYTKVTVDTKGRVSAGGTINFNDVTTALSFTPLTETLASGKIVVGNASGIAAPVTMTGDASIDNTGALTLANSGATAGSYGASNKATQVTVNAKGLVTAVSQVTIDDNTKLPLAGGTMTGPIAMGANDITGAGNIAMAPNKSFLISNLTTAQETAFLALPSTPGTKGLMWYNTNTSKLMYYDGTTAIPIQGGSALVSLNGDTSAAQTVSVGNSAAADISMVNSGASHTINIPDASPTQRGALTASDYTAFNNKLTSVLPSAKIFVGNGTNVATAVSLSGDATITNTGSLGLSTTGVSAGTYTKVTVDTKGRVSVGGDINATDVITALTFTPQDQSLANGKMWLGNGSGIAAPVTMSGDATIDNAGALTIANNAITTAKINNLAVTNAKINDVAWGKITSTPTTIAGYGITDAILTNAGGVTSMQAGTLAARPAFGTAGRMYVTTDTGEIYRDTGTAWDKVGSATGLGGTVTNVSVGGLPLSVVNGTTTPTISIAQANTTTAGYLSAADWNIFNNKLGTSLTAGNIFVGNGSNVAVGVPMSGDATISATGALTLKNTGTAGTYGSASAIPSITTDAQGRVTGVTTNAYQDATAAAKGIVQVGSNITVSSGTISLTAANITGALTFTPISNSLASAKVLIGNSSGVAMPVSITGDATVDNTGALTLATSGATAGSYGASNKAAQVTVDAKGRVTGISQVTIDDTTKLPLAGGTMAGSIAMGGNNITGAGNITMASNKSFLISNLTAAEETALLALPSTPGTKGLMWYNTNTSKLMYYDGSAAIPVQGGSSITSLNGDTTAAQTISVGNAAGSDISMINSGASHTVNIPDASATQRGALTSTDWSTFNNKQTSSLASAKIWVGNGSGVAMPVTLSGEATITNTGVLGLSTTGVSSGTYTKVTVDTKGRVSVGGSINAGDITTALTFTPMDSALANAKMLIGNASGIAMPVSMSGDATIDNTGALTIANNAITTVKINNLAVTDAKINDVAWGKVTATPTTLSGYGITDALVKNAGGVTTFQSGTLATRPAFGTAGRMYVATDTGEIYRDDGTAWVKVGSAVGSGGTVTSVSVGGAPLSVVNGTTTPTISISQANGTTPGYLSAADWTAFNSKLDNALPSAKMWVGNGSGIAMPVSMSGDATMNNTGALGLVTTGVGAGTYTKLTVDAKGRATVGGQIGVTEITSGLGYTPISDVLTAGNIFVGNGSNVAVGVPMSGDATIASSGALTLKNTGTAGTYGSASAVPTLTTDAQGRVTAVTTNAYQDATAVGKGVVQVGSNITVSSGTISLTAANITGALTFTPIGNGLASAKILVGNASGIAMPVSMSGDATMDNAGVLSLASQGLTAGAYTKLTVNTKGIVTATGSISASDITGALTFTPISNGLASAKVYVGNASGVAMPVSITGDATVDNAGVLALKNTGTAGTYGSSSAVPTITTDAQGRVTSVSTNAYQDATGAVKGVVSVGSNITVSSGQISLTAVNVTGALTYTPMSDSLASAKIFVGNASGVAMPVSMSGDATMDNAGVLSLASQGLTSGAYTKLTVNAKGIVTATGSIAASDITSALTFTPISNGLASGKVYMGNGSGVAMPVSITGDATVDNTGVLTLASQGLTGGAYTKLTVNAKGIVTATGNIGSSDVTTALGFTPATSALASAKIFVGNSSGVAMPVSMSGDATIDNAGALTLKNTGTAGTYGSSSAVPTITTDAQGRVTSVSTNAYQDATGAVKGVVSVGSNITVSSGQISLTSGNVAGALGFTPATSALASAKIFVGNSSGVAMPVSMSGDATMDNAGVLSLASQGLTSGAYTKLTVNAKGIVTATGSLAATDVTGALTYTPLNKAGDTLGGTLNVNSNSLTNVGNIVMASDKTMLLSNVAPATETGFSFSSSDKGKIWYSTNTNQIMYYDGTSPKALGVAGAGITSINGLSGSTQTIAIGTSGTDIGINDSGSTHTINIPTASATNRGALSSADWTAFNSKLDTTLASAKIWVGNGSGVAMPVSMSGDATITNTGAIGLSTTGVGAGTYSKVTVDTKGRVTVGGSIGVTEITTGLGYTPISDVLTAGNIIVGNGSNVAVGVPMSGDATIASSGALTLKNTGTAGTYGSASAVPTLTTDAQGRVTGVTTNAYQDATAVTKGILQVGSNLTVSSGTISLTAANVTGALTYTPMNNGLASAKIFVGNSSGVAMPVSMSGDATMDNAGVLSLASQGLTSGAYTKLTVNAKGIVTATGNIGSSDVTGALGFTPITNSLASAKIFVGNGSGVAMPVSMSGDATIDNAGALTLKNTGTAGTYGSSSAVPTITTDAQGRVTSVSTNAYQDATGAVKGVVSVGSNITVSSGQISLTASNVTGALTFTPISNGLASGKVYIGNGSGVAMPVSITGDATVDNTGALTLASQGLTSGAYTKLTVNSKGIVTATGSIASADITGALGFTPATSALASAKIFVGNSSGVAMPVSMSGDATMDNAGVLSLASQGLTSGAYTKLTVNAKGIVTATGSIAASDITGALTFTPTSASLASAKVYVGNASGVAMPVSITGDATVDNAGVLTLASQGLTSGAYTKLTVNAKGIVTATGSIASSDITGALGFTPATNALASAKIFVGNASGVAMPVSMSGDATMDNAGALSLVSQGLTAGAYTKLTVNTKGIVTATGSLAASDITSALTFTPTSAALASAKVYIGNSSGVAMPVSITGDATVDNTGALTLASQGLTSGAYTKLTVNSKGIVTATGSIASSDITGALGFTPATNALASAKIFVGNASGVAMPVSMSGDATMDNAGALTLKNTGTAGTYGSASAVPTLTTDAQGRVTGVTTNAYQDATGVGKGIVQVGSNITVSSGTISLTAANVTGALTFTPIGNSLASAKIYVGNSSGVAMPVSMSGDATMDNAGALTLATQGGVTAGTYNKVTVNTKGLVTGTGSLAASDITTALTFTPTSASLASAKVYIGNASGVAMPVSITGDATVDNTGALTLASQGLTSGAYTKLTVNAKGIVTATGSLASADVTGALGFTPATNALAAAKMFVGNASGVAMPVSMSGDATMDNAGALTLATQGGVTAGTYNKVTVNTKGLVTGTGSLAASDITTALTFTPTSASLASAKVYIGNASGVAMPVSITGDATVDNTGALTLASQGLTSGAYTKLTVNAKGIVTATGSLASADVTGALGFTPATNALAAAKMFVGNASGVAMPVSMSGDATMDNAGAVTLKNTGTAGTYGSSSAIPAITTDAQGRVTGVTTSAYQDATTGVKGIVTIGSNITVSSGSISLTSGNVTGALGFTPTTNALASAKMFVGNASGVAMPVSMSGDATMDNAGAVTIANSAVTTAKIADANITTAKLFTNPGVSRLVATDSSTGANLSYISCSLNQILSWTASGWACASATAANFGNQAQNAFLAGPSSGGAGAPTFRTIASADLPKTGTDGAYVNGGNSFGSAATIGTNDANALTLKANNLSALTIDTAGVSQFNYQVVPKSVTGTAAASSYTWDTTNGNVLNWVTDAATPALTMTNVKAGGQYMVTIKSATATGAISLTCGSGTPSFIPSNGARTVGTLGKTVYSIFYDGTDCMVSWITGF